MVNPAFQLRTELARLGQGGSSSGEVLNLLKGIAPLIASDSRLVLRGFIYSEGALELTVSAPDAARFEGLREQLRLNSELKVEVGGHTDSRGSKEMNVRLSQARAESVRQYLLDHFKIAPGSLTAKGYGPPADGKVERNDAERQANRRVELKVVK